MKNIALIISLSISLFSALMATSTGSTTRAISIDGSIGSTVSNGTNSSSWENDEKASNTTTSNVDVYLSWDNTNLYLAFGGTSNSTSEAIVLYVDTDPNNTPSNGTGSVTGIGYDGPIITAPFTSNFVAYIKNGYDEYRTNSTGSWSAGTANELAESASGNDLEVAIPWNKMGGKPSAIYFIAYKVSGGGYKYGGAPGDIWVDGTGNATVSHYFSATIVAGENPFGGYDQSLPVELSSFSAQNTQRGVALKWVTDSEIENQGFIISRKTRTTRWQEIGSFSKDRALLGQGSTTGATRYVFLDSQVREGQTYVYMLSDVDYRGQRTDHDAQVQTLTYLIPEEAARPGRLELTRIYPNPFNPATTLSYDLSEASDVSVSIYDLKGNRVWQQVQPNQAAGQNHQITWQGLNHQGLAVDSGIYLVSIQAAGDRISQKVTLLR